MHRAKAKSLRISIVIITAFIICWTPYYTMMIIFMFLDPDKHLSKELQNVIFFFRHDQQFGKSFDIRRVSSVAAKETFHSQRIVHHPTQTYANQL